MTSRNQVSLNELIRHYPFLGTDNSTIWITNDNTHLEISKFEHMNQIKGCLGNLKKVKIVMTNRFFGDQLKEISEYFEDTINDLEDNLQKQLEYLTRK
ncbi:hypothetical protein [Neobacillus massiliamazoniensis]|uniref:Uncharacterized protein n=1 Tax=Neobacillus massiliamazoniensis TaxID=1499688 RepID=A0A0U1P032_9BACI|nr:hypothetical protein [Neobacillus massiliamazoniensis]CRK83640.1 hypothetical protein BN000_03612 [Neobacillus massiliamazoniensis]